MKIPTLKIEKSGVLLLTTPASSAATTRAYSRTGFLSCKRAISTKSRFSIFHQIQKSWESPLKIENCVVLLLTTPSSSAATTLVYSGSHSNFCWDGKPPEVSEREEVSKPSYEFVYVGLSELFVSSSQSMAHQRKESGRRMAARDRKSGERLRSRGNSVRRWSIDTGPPSKKVSGCFQAPSKRCLLFSANLLESWLSLCGREINRGFRISWFWLAISNIQSPQERHQDGWQNK